MVMGTETKKLRIGEILVELKYITKDQLREAIDSQKKNGRKRLGEILIDKKYVTSKQVLQALSKQLGYPVIDLTKIEPDSELLTQIPESLCKEYNVLPIKRSGKSIVVCVSDPLDLMAIENIKFTLNANIDCVLAPAEDIKQAIGKFYKNGALVSAPPIQDLEDLAGGALDKIDLAKIGDDDDAPIIKFVQQMIDSAVEERASDIHVEPMENRVVIRFRIDGVLKVVNEAPKRLQGSLLSRIKIMAQMDIAEKRKPQDGRIKVKSAGRELDIRVSSIASVHGESIVMRLLDRTKGLVSLEELGFHPTDYKRFKRLIKRPNGILLITGPTGSGKTTTLYAALKELNRPDVKIITAENPVEYNIEGLNQSQVKPQIGLTFARILRAMLRQAPNIILVGEIRDMETAEIAIQAALTGHLVFSTLHTNDAPSALTRLLDIGVKPFLVASSAQAVMAQRLVRVLCDKCKKPSKNPSPTLLKALGITQDQAASANICEPVGCDSCKNNGYVGRKGIFELMEVDSEMREMVFRREPLAKIRAHAQMRGMVTLLEDGVRKILTGMTSIQEVLSATRREDIAY